MSDDTLMDNSPLPPLRMATPGEYERLAMALAEFGRHTDYCAHHRGRPCGCGLVDMANEARSVMRKLATTIDQDTARELAALKGGGR